MASTNAPEGNSFGETAQPPSGGDYGLNHATLEIMDARGPVAFPETPEDEAKRIGKYFLENPVIHLGSDK